MRLRNSLRSVALSVVAITAIHAASGAPGKNILGDGSSFEIGVDGFSLNNYYLISHHGREIAPVFDDTTAVHGTRSLRLENPLGDKIVLAFRPIRLEQDIEVTVSGYLKGNGQVRALLKRWPWETIASADVDLTTEWERFSFTATIAGDQSHFLWILPTVGTRHIQLDALQIEEGGLTEFHPRTLALAASASADYNTYWVGDECALSIRLHADQPPATIPVSVTVLDIFRNERLKKAIRLETGGRNHVSANVPLFPARQRGSYKVIVEATHNGEVEREVFTIGVLKEVAKADPFFGFNHKQVFNEDAERRYSDNNEQRELVYANAPLDYTLGLMRKAGGYSLRCFRTAEYAKIEKPSGEYVWRDTYVGLQRQAGLGGPLVVLRARGPAWDADPAFKDPRAGRGASVPTVEEWRKYVRSMVNHYRGRVRYYEVVNEPETIFRDVQVYVDRLRAAYEVIRETDPDARIVAPSYSGSRPFPWLKQFCEAGGHKWVDIWAIHYAGRTLPERGMDRTTPTWELIRKYREILVKANGGVDKPFWNTEGGSFYWSPEYDHWPKAEGQGREDIGGEHYRVPSESLVAAYTPRLQLIEKACGLDREYSFEFGFYYSQNASKATDLWSMYTNFDGSPSPALVTYNAVADIFAGTSPVEFLDLEHGVIVTVFERDGGTVAALWKGAQVEEFPGFEVYDRPVETDVDLRAEDLTVTNMLGHPLRPERRGNGIRLTATAFPTYLIGKIPPAQAVDAFRSALLTLGPRPQVDASAEELMDARQYSAAIERFKDRLAKEPKDAGIPAAIGACYNELREYRQATPFFHQALELDPDLVSANAGLARCVGNDPNPDVPWSERMAKAALYMGKAIEPAVERVTRGRTGTYADLTDIYLCFYYLQNSTHVRGNAAKALTLLETATLIDPQAGNFRTKRMVTARPKIAAQAEKDAGKPAD